MTTNYLGGNVYLWSRAAQDRFLVHCLGPAIRDLQEQGLASGFWFDRYDLRGPHLFFLTRPIGDFAGVHEAMAERLESFLSGGPCPGEMRPGELEARHRQVRGNALCEADELPGRAENNSFLLFEHAPAGYPFRVAAHLKKPHEFWHLLEDLSFWSIRQIEASPEGVPAATGIRWAAALDLALRKKDVAREFWRHHAATLLPGLEQASLAGLAGAIGVRNREAFSLLWKEAETAALLWPQTSRLVEVALSAQREDVRFEALREAMHCAWKQLGLPVGLEVPLSLFAWEQAAAS